MKDKIISITQSLLCCVIYIAIIYILVIILGGKYISEANSYIELISTKTKNEQNTTLEMGENGLKTRPEYGREYGRVKISSVNIDLPLYFGNSLEILKDGIGQSTKSYCPGEGKTIVINGHNTDNMLKRLHDVKKDDIIIINTEYGSYEYEVFDMKAMSEGEIEIQTNSETLVMYTKNSTSNNKIYAVYAKLVNN